MANAAATANPQGSDSAYPSDALDNPNNLNFWEPGDEDDDQAKPDAQEDGIDPDVETDEAETGQEADDEAQNADETDEEAEEADQGEAEKPSQSTLADDTPVKLGNQDLTLGELKAGYMRDADYRNKGHELGNQRRELKALSDRVNSAVHTVSEFLSARIPPAPSANLAMTDPGKYVREQAMHDAAMTELSNLLGNVGAVKEVTDQLSVEEHNELVKRESALLADAIPEIRKDQKKFFDDVDVAGRELGFTDEEIKSFPVDHRYYKAMHYAMKGLAAEKAMLKAKAKVQDVPPVAPQKRVPSAAQNNVRANKDAMRRLEKTGSINDAMKIDFA